MNDLRSAASPRYVPPFPRRDERAAPVWAGLFGERARNAVHGWSEAAFETWHIRRQVLRFTVHIVLHPDSVQRVLQANASNYAKPDVVKRLIAPMIGRGLLSSDGALWREQRRIVAARFAPAAVDALIPAFAAAARARAERWAPGTRDMADEATATTMAIIADTLFGGDERLKSEAAMRHIAAALKAGGETRLAAILGLPAFAWNRTMREGRRGQDFLRSALADLVRERMAEGGGDDFLGMLIAALRERFPRGEALGLAVDNAATFYLAGHETTANAVTWTLLLLSEQPGWQERCSAEAQRAVAEGDGAELPERLPVLGRVLDEALRLYPPVPRFDRQAIGPDELGGHAIRAGDIVTIWPWLIQRHKKLWENPDAFDPDRFLPERAEGRHRFQHIPFGGGPRVCVGARFARAEALTVLAHWLAEWRFDSVAGRAVLPAGSVTLRPKGGLPLRLSRRQAVAGTSTDPSRSARPPRAMRER